MQGIIMRKMKKAGLLFLALLLGFSPARSEDSFWPVIAVAGTAAFVVGGIYCLINLPDYCPACDYAIKNGSPTVRRYCGHDFHADCYNARGVCRSCERNIICEKELASLARDVQERRRLQDEYNAVLAREAKDAEQARMQRAYRERQAAQEQKNASAYQASRAQQEEFDRIARKNAENARRKQEEQDSERVAQSIALEERNKVQAAENRRKNEEAAELQRQELARRNVENAQREQELKRQKQAQAAEKRQKDAENKRKEEIQNDEAIARELQNQEIKNAEQARIKNTAWMMEDCSWCLRERAWDEAKDCYIDVTKPENKLHTVALPCGHVFHTKCIKMWAAGKHQCACPICHTLFDVRDL